MGKIVKKGKVYTKARKLRNNLTEKERIKNLKTIMKKEVLSAKVVPKKKEPIHVKDIVKESNITEVGQKGYKIKGGFKDFWGARLPNISTDPKQAEANLTEAKLKWEWAENQKSGKNDVYWSRVQDKYHEWAQAQREFIKVNGRLNIDGNPYIKLEGGAGFLMGGGGEVKYDGSTFTIKVNGGVNGKIAANVGLTAGAELKNGSLDEDGTQYSLSAAGGNGAMVEGGFTTDGEYWELMVGGGAGIGVEVKLLPVVESKVYKEYTIVRLDAPMPEPGARYVGSPTAEEWSRMLSGKGWGN